MQKQGPAIALDQIRASVAANLDRGVVRADAAYSINTEFRPAWCAPPANSSGLERRGPHAKVDMTTLGNQLKRAGLPPPPQLPMNIEGGESTRMRRA